MTFVGAARPHSFLYEKWTSRVFMTCNDAPVTVPCGPGHWYFLRKTKYFLYLCFSLLYFFAPGMEQKKFSCVAFCFGRTKDEMVRFFSHDDVALVRKRIKAGKSVRSIALELACPHVTLRRFVLSGMKTSTAQSDAVLNTLCAVVERVGGPIKYTQTKRSKLLTRRRRIVSASEVKRAWPRKTAVKCP